MRNCGMAPPKALLAEHGRGATERHRGWGSWGSQGSWGSGGPLPHSGSQEEPTTLLSGILSRCPLHRGRCCAPQPSLLSNFREKLIKHFKRLVNYNSRST